MLTMVGQCMAFPPFFLFFYDSPKCATWTRMVLSQWASQVRGQGKSCKSEFTKNMLNTKMVVKLNYSAPERKGWNTLMSGPGVCVCWPLMAVPPTVLCLLCHRQTYVLPPLPVWQPSLGCCFRCDCGTGWLCHVTLLISGLDRCWLVTCAPEEVPYPALGWLRPFVIMEPTS